MMDKIKFKGGPRTRSDRQVLNKRKTEQGASELFKDGGAMKTVKRMMGGGMYADGGMPMVERAGKKVPAFAADGKGKMAKGGMPGMHKKPPMKKMASGGLAAGHKAADGVASKGKTKAKQVKMAYGGKC